VQWNRILYGAASHDAINDRVRASGQGDRQLLERLTPSGEVPLRLPDHVVVGPPG
jgi:hypothetical protein